MSDPETDESAADAAATTDPVEGGEAAVASEGEGAEDEADGDADEG